MVRILALLTTILLLTGCGGSPSGLRIAGSTSLQPLTEALAEDYARTGGGRVIVQGGGSTAGVQAVLSGIAGMGAISRRLTAAESEKGLVEHIIGYDVLTVVVHPDNPVGERGLTLPELREMFQGSIVDWAGLGGRPGPVYLVTREAGSGSREAFRSLVGPISPRAIVQNSAGGVRVAVTGNPGAVGYVSLGVARMGGVRPVAVNGRRPGEPGYPLVRPLSLITLGPPRGEAAAFLRYIRTPAARRLIAQEGLVPG